MVRTLLGIPAIAAWARLLNVPCTLGALGGLRTLDDAPSRGLLDRRTVVWLDPMKDREIGRYLQGKRNG